jgi:putative ABC transport system permease protein
MRLLPIEYAVRNLGRSAARLCLSVLGGVLVVVLVMGAGGFVAGMRASLRPAGHERNVLVLGTGSEESLERSEIPASTAGLLAASLAGVRSAAGVKYVSPEVHVQLRVVAGGAGGEPGDAAGRDAGALVLVRGVTPAALLVHPGVQVVEGRPPMPGAGEVMAGRLAHVRLGLSPSALAVGRTVMIEGRPWRVSGVMAAPGSVIEAEVWMPLTDLKQLTRRETDSCVVLTLGEGPGAAELADVEAFCRQRLDLEITAMSERAYYGALAAFFAPIRLATWVGAGLIAVGALLGGMNTMYAAFAARARELGMLRCLGYRAGAIVVSLVTESCLATAAGAVIGAAASMALLDGVAVQFSMGAFGLRIEPWVVVAGLAAGLGLGLAGAIPPAVRCLRMPIPEALKAV